MSRTYVTYVAGTRIEYKVKGNDGFSSTYFGKAGETLGEIIMKLGNNAVITKFEILDVNP